MNRTVQVNLSELAKTLGYAEGVVPPGKVLFLLQSLCVVANKIRLRLLTKVVESPESKAMRRMSMENMQVDAKIESDCYHTQQFATLVLIDVTGTLTSYIHLKMRMANPVQVIKMTPDAKAKAKAKEKASSSEGGHSPDQVRNNVIEIFNII